MNIYSQTSKATKRMQKWQKIGIVSSTAFRSRKRKTTHVILQPRHLQPHYDDGVLGGVCTITQLLHYSNSKTHSRLASAWQMKSHYEVSKYVWKSVRACRHSHLRTRDWHTLIMWSYQTWHPKRSSCEKMKAECQFAISGQVDSLWRQTVLTDGLHATSFVEAH